MLVAGSVALAEGDGIGLVQLDSDTGELDPAVNLGLPLIYHACKAVEGDCSVSGMVADRTPDGSIAIGGTPGLTPNLETHNMFAARLRPDGTPDASFGSATGLAIIDFGQGMESSGLDMVLQGGRIVIGGSAALEDADDDFALARVSGGTLFRDGFDSTP